MKQLNYGDVIQVTTTNNFWTDGQKMYVVVPEGDGELGLPEHAVCFKLTNDGKPDKSAGAFEVPWAEMDFSTLQDAAEMSLGAKVKKLEGEIKTKTASKAAAEKILSGIKRDTQATLQLFAKEME